MYCIVNKCEKLSRARSYFFILFCKAQVNKHSVISIVAGIYNTSKRLRGKLAVICLPNQASQYFYPLSIYHLSYLIGTIGTIPHCLATTSGPPVGHRHLSFFLGVGILGVARQKLAVIELSKNKSTSRRSCTLLHRIDHDVDDTKYHHCLLIGGPKGNESDNR